MLDSVQIQKIVNIELRQFMIENNVTGVAIQTLNKSGEWDTKLFKLQD
ncbi:MAG: hypothetical protein ACI8ZM_003142 [Crocinitomix sp.]|jgi:hypothetical protein